MTKRLDNTTTYLVNGYAVTLTRLRNDINGNPRYQAELIPLDNLTKYGSSCAIRYTFTGHFLSEKGEAERVVEYHIQSQR